MIEVLDLTKNYGHLRAVDGVSFTIPAGRITGFLGPNGAGKSTTMRVITGFTPASGGRVQVAGFDVAREPLEVKRRVGYLPEHVPLYEEMTVRGFLGFVAGIKGIARGERRSEVDRVMDRCGLTVMAHRIIGNLSKGYRQRVGLAQALLGNPPVLILDEPTVGLDPRQIAEVRAMIRAFGGEHTVLLSTHILPEVSMVCDGVIIIHRGRVVYDGPVPDAGKGGASLEELFMRAVATDAAGREEETGVRKEEEP
ncbi:MAG: ATP-binding cassette domain-containing protein [Candidatus Hydrogenedentes bacterium]|nr:ATP-binding cassette domain-containing protein [Candidatus Hydrogenedentota bacterium]